MADTKLYLFVLLSVFTLNSGCLQTRAALKNETHSVQAKQAQEESKFDEINKDFRQLNGRIESLEAQTKNASDNEKVKSLEQKISQLESKIVLLETTVADLNTKAKKEQAAYELQQQKEKERQEEAKNPLAAGNKYFDGKKWEDAILAFEDYRKNNPKGRNYPEATFKIGICFQSLGMKEDAKAFYKEVVDKYPSSKEASQAKTKLKKM